jgi:hypothetical protein
MSSQWHRHLADDGSVVVGASGHWAAQNVCVQAVNLDALLAQWLALSIHEEDKPCRPARKAA